MIKNILTFDLEDWYHGNFLFDEYGKFDHSEERVLEPTHRTLDLLEKTGNRATFFVLGEIAEKYPNIVREIYQRGHEIGSHSFYHKLVYRMTPKEFEENIKRSKYLLEDIIGDRIYGFRAPYWSIYKRNKWVWPILAKYNILYDSSLYPFKTYLYGENKYERFYNKINFSKNGRYIAEIPPTTLEISGKRIPFSGGVYFRLMPYRAIRWSARHINRTEKKPVVFYSHPYEIDPNKPKSSRGLRNNFILHVNVKKAEKKLIQLFNDFRFIPVIEYIRNLN